MMYHFCTPSGTIRGSPFHCTLLTMDDAIKEEKRFANLTSNTDTSLYEKPGHCGFFDYWYLFFCELTNDILCKIFHWDFFPYRFGSTIYIWSTLNIVIYVVNVPWFLVCHSVLFAMNLAFNISICNPLKNSFKISNCGVYLARKTFSLYRFIFTLNVCILFFNLELILRHSIRKD